MKENEINQTDYHSLSTFRILTNSNNISNSFTTAHDLLVDRFSIQISKNKKIELTLGDKVCFVKPTSDLVCCDTIVRGHLSKKYGGLESPTVYVLVADNKLDFYKIVEKAHKKYKMDLDIVLNRTIVKRVFTIHQLANSIDQIQQLLKANHTSEAVTLLEGMDVKINHMNTMFNDLVWELSNKGH